MDVQNLQITSTTNGAIRNEDPTEYQPAKPDLMGLPVEIRSQILSYLLQSSTEVSEELDISEYCDDCREHLDEEAERQGHLSHDFRDSPKLYPEVLSVCHQLHDEGKQLLYTGKTICFTYHVNYEVPQRTCGYVLGHDSIAAAIYHYPNIAIMRDWNVKIYIDSAISNVDRSRGGLTGRSSHARHISEEIATLKTLPEMRSLKLEVHLVRPKARASAPASSFRGVDVFDQLSFVVNPFRLLRLQRFELQIHGRFSQQVRGLLGRIKRTVMSNTSPVSVTQWTGALSKLCDAISVSAAGKPWSKYHALLGQSWVGDLSLYAESDLEDPVELLWTPDIDDLRQVFENVRIWIIMWRLDQANVTAMELLDDIERRLQHSSVMMSEHMQNCDKGLMVQLEKQVAWTRVLLTRIRDFRELYPTGPC